MEDQLLYKELAVLNAGLARIEGKIDAALYRLGEQRVRLDDHSHRLHVLERFRWFVVGGAALLGFLITARENLAGLLKALGK